MLINRNNHRVQLPAILNSHQVVVASRYIHDKVQAVVNPQLEAKPQYHAVRLMLEKVDLAIGQLKTAHDRRKYKGPKDQRNVGAKDGKFDYEAASQLKQQLYRARKSQLKRLRIMIDWQHNPAVIDLLQSDLVDPLQIAAKRVAEILHKRPDRFEDLNYIESLAETQYMIDDIEADPEVLAAIELIGVSGVYSSIKSLQTRFREIHEVQTSDDARREELPKVTEATRDLRHLVNKLLSLLHFDVENDDPTFLKVLGALDEIMDKEHASAARRITLAKKKAAQQKAVSNQAANQQPTTDASGATDANAEADGEPPADGGTGGASGGVSGETSGGDADQGSDADTDQTPVDADPVADANSDQQQVPGEVETA